MWEEKKQEEKSRQNKTKSRQITPKKVENSRQQTEDFSNIDRKKWWKISPILETEQRHNINFAMEEKEQVIFGLEGHDQQDREINKIQFQNRMKEVYADVLKELAKKKG